MLEPCTYNMQESTRKQIDFIAIYEIRKICRFDKDTKGYIVRIPLPIGVK
jgi:hypothetical protein